MKTTKLVLIAAFVSFAMLSFANAEVGLSKNEIHLKTALTYPEIAAAIQSQVQPDFFLRCRCEGTHTAAVKVGSTMYLVYATFADWRVYFKNANSEKPVGPIGPGGVNPHEFDDSPQPNPFSTSNPFSNAGKKPLHKKVKPPLVEKR